MRHLTKKPPYSDTSIGYIRSQGDITEMLKEFGATAMRWTETPDSMSGNGLPVLEFILTVEIKGMKKEIGIKLEVPMLEKKIGRGYRTKVIPNLNASMRLLYWYLKTRLEASIYGLEDIHETLMSKIMVSLPDGSASTMGKVMRDRPEIISDMLPSFEIKQIESKYDEKTVSGNKIIDVEKSE